MRRIRWVLPALVISTAVLLQACGRNLEPQSTCDFVQNSALQRVSWKTQASIKIYLHNSIPSTEYIRAIERAVDEWNQTMGYTVLRIEATHVSGSGQPVRDGNSVIYWMNTWDANQPGEQARTTIYWSSNRIYEGDIRINAKNFQYATTDSPQAGKVDLQSLMVHELGHVLGLAHSTKPASVMSKTLSSGFLRRDVSVNDQKNIACEYPVNGHG